jgi:hypothetical protein
MRWLRHGNPVTLVNNSPADGLCQLSLCDRPYLANGFCRKHFDRGLHGARRIALDHYKLTHGCEGCNFRTEDPRLLEFHHRDPAMKLFTVSKGRDAFDSVQMQAEIAKCDVLCRPCHIAVEALENPCQKAA